ncbi:hypothetical protein CFC21_011121 [Triticum aestivum]|uniref:RING-type E3 ubiquitin transferase n=3 Tax=Triticinae TaxID=1648030 RepID=A0A9R1IVD4_WHEAT|nr:probable E3 ubiquitin-protein ligase XERICO [Aegilops tauschii subsp. strangulata]XP_044449048.1 probable E3 ubiquitin-protein ligase XERICO [Triticum aestivum]KAF6994415.1 hypothetical protein CFC21_011121 [Triticum aestivum]
MVTTMGHVVALLSAALSGSGSGGVVGCGRHDDHYHSGGCCVCISRFRDGEDIRSLPCGHAFHRQCVDRWLALCRRTCPLCRLHVGGVTDEHQLSDDLVIWFSSLFVAGL